MSKGFKLGAILENSIRQFTKVVSVRNGVYGITGWMTRQAAEKSSVAHNFVNAHGLRFAGARVVGEAETPTASPKGDEAPKASKPKKAASKTTKPKAKAGGKGKSKK